MARDGNPATPSPVATNRAAPDRLLELQDTALEPIWLTGMTCRANVGLIAPTHQDPTAGTGKPALSYTAVLAVEALIVCELRRARFTLREVQHVALNLENRGSRLAESDANLRTDGWSVNFAFSDDEVVDVLKHRRQMLLLASLPQQLIARREVA
jgi:hypothetical protein